MSKTGGVHPLSPSALPDEVYSIVTGFLSPGDRRRLITAETFPECHWVYAMRQEPDRTPALRFLNAETFVGPNFKYSRGVATDYAVPPIVDRRTGTVQWPRLGLRSTDVYTDYYAGCLAEDYCRSEEPLPNPTADEMIAHLTHMQRVVQEEDGLDDEAMFVAVSGIEEAIDEIESFNLPETTEGLTRHIRFIYNGDGIGTKNPHSPYRGNSAVVAYYECDTEIMADVVKGDLAQIVHIVNAKAEFIKNEAKYVRAWLGKPNV